MCVKIGNGMQSNTTVSLKVYLTAIAIKYTLSDTVVPDCIPFPIININNSKSNIIFLPSFITAFHFSVAGEYIFVPGAAL